MSILWMDGFDFYSSTVPLTTRYTFTSNGLDNTATGRFTGKAITNGITGATSRIAHTFTSQSALSLGFSFKFNTATTSDRPTLYLKNGSTTICCLHLRGLDKKLVFTRGSSIGSNVLATSSAALINNTWHHIGLEFTRNASAGTVNLYLDGVQVASVTGVNSGASDIDTIEIEMFSNANTIFMDDYYVVSGATWLGERKVTSLRPAADTADKDWTPNSGTDNYTRVNQTTMDGDTSYNSSATVTDKDLFDMDDFSATPTTVDAVQVILAARKDDAATREVTPLLKSSSTTHNCTALAPTTDYKLSVTTLEQDPATSAAWVPSAVNSIQAGYEVTV